MKRPNIVIHLVLGALVKVYAFFKGQRVIKSCKIKGPAIVLSNHTSFYDFIYTSAAMYPKRLTYLAVRKMFYEPVPSFFLKLYRAIPKSLMQADPGATLKAFRILEKKGIIAIFPEGQISNSGKLLPPAFSIAKFLKKAKVDVYMVKHMGAGLVNPPWSKFSFKGRIETTKEMILSKEELSTLSLEDIYNQVFNKLNHSTSEDNKDKQYRYKVQPINNLENLIYQCPSCLYEGIKQIENQLICPKCNHTLTYDHFGLLNGIGIDEFFFNQAQHVNQSIENDPNFTIESNAKLMSFRNKRLVVVGQGKLTVKRYQYVYEGTVDGEFKTLTFHVSSTPTLPSDIGRNVQIYEGNDIFQFELDVPWVATKIVHVGDYLYQTYLQSQNQTFS